MYSYPLEIPSKKFHFLPKMFTQRHTGFVSPLSDMRCVGRRQQLLEIRHERTQFTWVGTCENTHYSSQPFKTGSTGQKTQLNRHISACLSLIFSSLLVKSWHHVIKSVEKYSLFLTTANGQVLDWCHRIVDWVEWEYERVDDVLVVVTMITTKAHFF